MKGKQWWRPAAVLLIASTSHTAGAQTPEHVQDPAIALGGVWVPGNKKGTW